MTVSTMWEIDITYAHGNFHCIDQVDTLSYCLLTVAGY